MSPALPEITIAARFIALTRIVATILVTLLTGCSTSERPVNVVFISIDSQRADTLSCYGYQSPTGVPTSPRLDQLAKEGVLFEQAVSTTSWTMPAHHAMFSGLPDILHGAWDDFHTATPDRVILPAELQNAGYQTAGFYSGLYLQESFGFADGFDVYQNASLLPMSHRIRPEQREAAALERAFHTNACADTVSHEAIKYLERATEEAAPFFLFLHYFDVHYDYVPPQERYARQYWPPGQRPRISGDYFLENPEINADLSAADRAGLMSYYLGETYWVDEQIGRVLDALSELGLEEDTLVVVTADHGDEFFEHGQKGHRNNLYDESLRVPLILRLPGRLPAGQRCPHRVSIVDLPPTIFELVGVVPDTDSPVSLTDGMWGQSLVPLIEGEESSHREAVGYLYNTQDATRPTNRWSLWSGQHKVIVSQVFAPDTGRQTIQATTVEVYDLENDPGETKNLAQTRTEAVTRALQRFNQVYPQLLYPMTKQLTAGPIPAFDETEREATREQLAALGYLAPQRVSEQPPPPTLTLSPR